MTNCGSDRGMRPSEFELIERLFAPLATAPGAFGLNDDVATLAPRMGHDLVLKVDAIVEGVHFLATDPADSVAKKALRVNLSDLAAKGATPLGYLLSLSMPDSTGMRWLESFANGLAEDQQTFGISLLGGDTTATPGPLSLAVTAIGEVASETMTRRQGARTGDSVFVSGSIGDAGGGLAISRGGGGPLSKEEREYLIARYRLPSPRLSLGCALRGLATSALDVSDGLIADLGHIADVSKVRILVEAERIPRSPALRALWGDDLPAIVRAATAGDDYEIAFTAPAGAEPAVLEVARRTATPVTRIGRVEGDTGVGLLDANGRDIPVARGGFTHF